MCECRLEIAFLKRWGQFGPKFQVAEDVPTNHSSFWKARWIELSRGIRTWAELSFDLSQFTSPSDGRTDGFTIATTTLHRMQRGNNKTGEGEIAHRRLEDVVA